MILEFQPVEHASQWATAAELANTMRPEGPYTGPQLELYADEIPADKFSSRHLALHDGEAVAYVRMIQNFWFADQTRCNATAFTPPGPKRIAILTSCLEFMNALGKANGMTILSPYVRSDDKDVINFYESRGFEKGQVNPVSALDLNNFSFEAYQHRVRAIGDLGYELVTVREFAARFPKDWIRQLYDFDMELSRDVPMSQPFTGIPFEMFEKMTLSRATNLDAYWVALKDGIVAGQSQINPNMADPTMAGTGLTGVRRQFRRQGLATALKATAIQWAYDAGIRTIFTDNEENNPMYQLNLDLGYRRVRDMISYSRAVL